MSEKTVIAYADWTPFEHPIPIGVLSFRILRGMEVYSFSYSEAWLNTGVQYYPIGGSLLPFAGRQYPPAHAKPLPILFDSAPDRWGRTLLLRRESLIARKEGRRPRTLMESDFLLGVHDNARIGAIRFATSEDGQFLSHSDILATPPMVRLRELEQSASMWEQYKGRSNEEKWLMPLIASGSSLGGARPKATVADEHGNLWVAKFPSSRDVIDKGAWEMVAHDLALSVGITVPRAQVQRLSKSGTTYLSQRFDRAGDGQRIHFCSALSLLGKHDGEHGSYLELVEFRDEKRTTYPFPAARRLADRLDGYTERLAWALGGRHGDPRLDVPSVSDLQNVCRMMSGPPPGTGHCGHHRVGISLPPTRRPAPPHASA